MLIKKSDLQNTNFSEEVKNIFDNLKNNKKLSNYLQTEDIYGERIEKKISNHLKKNIKRKMQEKIINEENQIYNHADFIQIFYFIFICIIFIFFCFIILRIIKKLSK